MLEAIGLRKEPQRPLHHEQGLIEVALGQQGHNDVAEADGNDWMFDVVGFLIDPQRLTKHGLCLMEFALFLQDIALLLAPRAMFGCSVR